MFQNFKKFYPIPLSFDHVWQAVSRYAQDFYLLIFMRYVMSSPIKGPDSFTHLQGRK